MQLTKTGGKHHIYALIGALSSLKIAVWKNWPKVVLRWVKMTLKTPYVCINWKNYKFKMTISQNRAKVVYSWLKWGSIMLLGKKMAISQNGVKVVCSLMK